MRYPIGIQTFSEIINGGFVYADKTGFIHDLLRSGKYYFLSRPRRFGKSLFLSTLQAYFEGKRELFAGLALNDFNDLEWTPRPVIKLQLNALDPKSEEDLMQMIGNQLAIYESIYGKLTDTDRPATRFHNLLMQAFLKTGLQAAVLIDEYDAPLLATLHKPELNESYRETLKSVFSVLKTADEYIRFAFVTGVSRFSQTSLFSGANNLKDISLTDKYGAICGITEKELKRDFMPGIITFAKEQELTEEEAMQVLKDNYDGYHFSKKCPDIYNPFSVLGALDERHISDYWFKSGTPSYLIEIIKRDDFYLPDLDCISSLESDLSTKESYLNSPVALLFETGYVTIKGYDKESQMYTLGLPNKEVAMSFSKALLPVYSGNGVSETDRLFVKMREALIDGKPEYFLDLISTFMEGNPYSNTEMRLREIYFKNNLFILLRALGFEPQTERETCRGRIDLILQTRRRIYIFELKTGRTPQEALQQIEQRGYALPYRHSDRQVILIAANYDPESNNIRSIVKAL